MRETKSFKIGETVVCIADKNISCTDHEKLYVEGKLKSGLEVGKHYKVVEYKNESYGEFVSVVGETGILVTGTYAFLFDHLNNKYKSMSLKTTIKNILRTEPEKSFVKAGFIDENEQLTEKGIEALHFILWEKNKTELKELADKINDW